MDIYTDELGIRCRRDGYRSGGIVSQHIDSKRLTEPLTDLAA